MLQQKLSSPSTIQQGTITISDPGYVVGADIGGTSLRLALADMEGTILARWATTTAGIRDPQIVVNLIRDGVEQLLQQVSAPVNSLRAIAAGAPGVTDVDGGIVIATSYLMGWQDVPLRALLESALGVPAAIDNDVNMAAIGESQVGAARGTRDFVFLAVGTGIGAGIILNGRLFQGMGWSAGEIGYMVVPGTPTEPAGASEPGALEALAGGEGIKTQWRNAWRPDLTTLPNDLTATQIFDHAIAGDALAQGILKRTSEVFAYAIFNISLILNCPLFVLGGSVGMHPAFVDATQAVLDQREEHARPKLERSTLGAEAQVIGAIRVALDAAASRAHV
jgi:glucokinase